VDAPHDLRDETERHRAAISTAFEAWQDDGAPLTDYFAPEMTGPIEGHSAASHANKPEFIDEVLDPFGRRFSTSDPFRPLSIARVYADGDSVIVLWDGRGTTVQNTTYENSYAWFMQMCDGKVIDGTAFYDSISFNKLWAHVTPAGHSNPQ
jgi:ketosteroid isomerase-like protein